MQSKFAPLFLLFGSLLPIASNCHAAEKDQIYFWYDDAGIIHFAEQRPQGKRVYAVDVDTAPANQNQAMNSQYSYDDLFKDDAEAAEIESNKPKSPEEQAIADERCKAAKRSLWVLDHKTFVRQEAEDGTTQTLSVEQKQAIRLRSEQEVTKYCQ
jgi:hypothetical protein